MTQNLDYLVVEGNIGAGKTSLSRMLANSTDARIVLEQFAENPFLPKFYAEPKRYSFALELSFLAERYQQLTHEVNERSLFQGMVIADYYFMKSLIFAQNTLEEDEFNLYKRLFYIIYASLPKPSLYVYLHLSKERLLENIKKRGRDYEQKIDSDYLQTVQEGYFSFMKQHQTTQKFLIIDTNSIDFVHNAADYEMIQNVILKKVYPLGITRVVL